MPKTKESATLVAKTEFPVDVYSTKVSIYVCKTSDAMMEELKKLYKENNAEWSDEDDNYEVGGYTIYFPRDSGKYYIVLTEDSMTYNTICHEAWHVTHLILEGCDITENLGGEPGAYLHGYICSKIFSFLNKNKIKIDNSGEY